MSATTLRQFLASCEVKTYTGVGSRRAPPEILKLMYWAAKRLAAEGWTLRSGAAAGSDEAFEAGALDNLPCPHERVEIFLPWEEFRGRVSPRECPPTAAAFSLAERYHPAWERLTPSARALMARNSHQVLGADLQSPCAFVLCWTPDGAKASQETSRDTGGTGQAIRIASSRRIPVFNLARSSDFSDWGRYTAQGK